MKGKRNNISKDKPNAIGPANTVRKSSRFVKGIRTTNAGRKNQGAMENPITEHEECQERSNAVTEGLPDQNQSMDIRESATEPAETVNLSVPPSSQASGRTPANDNQSNDSTDEDLVISPRRSKLSTRRNARANSVTPQNLSHDRGSSNTNNYPATAAQADENLQVINNRLKAELLEALRDKRAYAAAFTSLKEQKEAVGKEIRSLKQQNMALEAALSSCRRGKKGKHSVWSMASLSGTNIAAYQGICLAAGEIAKQEAVLVTTESYIDEKENGIRKRNWNGSAAVLSDEHSTISLMFIRLPNNSRAVPTFSMLRATSYEYYVSPYVDVKGFARHCLEKTLASAVGSNMTQEEKTECISLILAHRQSIQKFRSVLSDSVGNRKKSALSIYLRSLGYFNGAKSNSDKLSSAQKASRKLEREIAYDKCVVISDDGRVDTMHWRVSQWSQLCLESTHMQLSDEMGQAEKDMVSEGKVDNLFMNEAARRAFIDLRGYEVSQNSGCSASILSLARADAAITTMLKWITTGGRGGVRNNNFNDCFRDLLPKAMESIVSDIWDDLQELAPHEMIAYIGEINSSTHDPHCNQLREWTFVMQHPDDKYVYLLASPKYFTKKVCSWYGEVVDCHIGRCRPGERLFSKINASVRFEEIEDSDVDDDDPMSNDVL